MTDNNKHENKTEELLEKQEARQLTDEELEQVNGGNLIEVDTKKGTVASLTVTLRGLKPFQ